MIGIGCDAIDWIGTVVVELRLGQVGASLQGYIGENTQIGVNKTQDLEHFKFEKSFF